jgi:hypothetical protein
LCRAVGRQLPDQAVERHFASRINYETLTSYRRKIADTTLRLRAVKSM